MGLAWNKSRFAREAGNQYGSNGGKTNMAAKHLKVRNWEEFQHYKDRNPPWIKLHFAIFASEDWVLLSDSSKLLMIVCMLIASRNEGIIPNNPAYIKRVAYLQDDPDLTPLIKCGFLNEYDASICAQTVADARPEERRGEAETEERRGRGRDVSRADRPTVSASPITFPEAAQAASAYQTRRYRTPNPRAAYYPVLLQEVADVFAAVTDKDAALKLFLQTCESSPLPKEASFSDLAKSCGLKKEKAKELPRPSQQLKDYTAERLAKQMGLPT